MAGGQTSSFAPRFFGTLFEAVLIGFVRKFTSASELVTSIDREAVADVRRLPPGLSLSPVRTWASGFPSGFMVNETKAITLSEPLAGVP